MYRLVFLQQIYVAGVRASVSVTTISVWTKKFHFRWPWPQACGLSALPSHLKDSSIQAHLLHNALRESFSLFCFYIYSEFYCSVGQGEGFVYAAI